MQVQAITPRQHFDRVLQEFDALAQACPEGDSFVATLLKNGQLQREGQVWWLAQGLHCIIYATTRHTHRGRPILGKQYGNFLFDPYRRNYMFKGKVSPITDAWQTDILARSDAAYRGGVKDLQTLVQEERAAGNLANVQAAEDAIAQSNAAFARDRATQKHTLEETAAVVQDALRALRGKRYPAVDYFLRDLAQALPAHKVCTAPRDLVRALYAPLCRANGTGKLEEREIWPLFENDSWRCTADNYFGMRFDNLLHGGHSKTYKPAQILPWRAGPKPVDAGPTLSAPKHAPPDGVFKRICKAMALPVRHGSVREAFRSHLRARDYFDEHLQRSVAVDEDALALLPTDREAAQRAHNEQVRAKALAALQQPIAVSNPAIAQAVAEQRRQQARAIASQATFPVFAHVPWRRSAAEAEVVRQKHVAFFCNLPRDPEDIHHGNCNSIGAALVKHACAIEAGTPESQLPDVISGRLRTVGRTHTVRLPRCQP